MTATSVEPGAVRGQDAGGTKAGVRGQLGGAARNAVQDDKLDTGAIWASRCRTR